MTDIPTLDILLQRRPWSAGLMSGLLRPNGFRLRFDPSKEAASRFKALLREHAFDCGEVAVASYLQARAAGTPYVLLPFAVSGAFGHGTLYVNAASGIRRPKDLEGRRVGVKAYAQTTVVWARGLLQHDFGVDLDRIRWVTFEDAHVEAFADPPGCERAGPGSDIGRMLERGDLDAAVIGIGAPQTESVRPLFEDAAAAAAGWAARYCDVPVNHMFVVHERWARERPDLVRNLFELLVEARDRSGIPLPAGFDADWRGLELLGRYCAEQGVIPEAESPATLFASARRILDLA